MRLGFAILLILSSLSLSSTVWAGTASPSSDSQADLSSTGAAPEKTWGDQSFNDEDHAKVKAFVKALLDNSGRVPAAIPHAKSTGTK